MASMIFNNFLKAIAAGEIDCDTDTFKCAVYTGTLTLNKDTMIDRADLTNEVSGTGYTAGGATATVGVTKDDANDRTDISLGAVSWPSSTIAGAKIFVWYKSTGTAANDLLVAAVEAASAVSTSNGTLSIGATTVRLTNGT